MPGLRDATAAITAKNGSAKAIRNAISVIASAP